MLTLKNAAGTAVEYHFVAHQAGMSTSYIGPDHSDLLADSITLTTAAPARKGNDYGNRRSRANLQRAVTVTSPSSIEVVKNAKLELLASVPVGMTQAQFTELCARQAELLSNVDYVKFLFIQGRTEF